MLLEQKKSLKNKQKNEKKFRCIQQKTKIHRYYLHNYYYYCYSNIELAAIELKVTFINSNYIRILPAVWFMNRFNHI